MMGRGDRTPAEVPDEFIEQALAGLAADPEHSWMAASSTLREVWVSGCWLVRRLSELGANQEDTERVGFAFGQMCVGREPWALLEETIAAWQADQMSDPGPDLADRLFDSSPDGQVGAILNVIDELDGAARD